MIDYRLIDILSGRLQPTLWQRLQANQLIDGGGADTGGPNKLAHGRFSWSDGLLAFKPVKRPSGQPWDNLYCYQTLARQSACTLFSLGIDFSYASQSDFTASTAFECELELCIAGLAFNMGLQSKGSKVDGPPAWRMFNQGVTPRRWDVISGTPLPGASASMTAFFSINRDEGTTTHEAIRIDDVLYPIGETHPAVRKWSPSTNYLHAALQLDSDGRGSPQAVKITRWEASGL